ncbi:hypothetical protein SKAU_G00359580 [Synaphobranchus kaupii]|uniref:Uncharacterized protein n=1 Tax=Synaphobranchus kaupii TaxID=118154 RepID=A0A9Q1EI38_SYNKA|nr:hypothetical protein SKAU_G00359580 [Synaphobranchus kaupii]
MKGHPGGVQEEPVIPPPEAQASFHTWTAEPKAWGLVTTDEIRRRYLLLPFPALLTMLATLAPMGDWADNGQ